MFVAHLLRWSRQIFIRPRQPNISPASKHVNSGAFVTEWQESGVAPSHKSPAPYRHGIERKGPGHDRRQVQRRVATECQLLNHVDVIVSVSVWNFELSAMGKIADG